VTKAAYDVFRSSAVTVLKKAELEGKHSAAELRLIRHTLNDFTQSVFLQVRAHLRMPGVVEPIDDSLAQQAEQAKEAYKQARVALQVEMDGVESLIDQSVKAPLADLDLNAVSAPASVRLPSEAQIARLASTEAQMAATVSKLSSTMPDVLEAARQHAEYLSSTPADSVGPSQPLSAEVRSILTRLNQDLVKGKKGGRKSTTKAAAAKVAETEGGAGKSVKSPTARLNARLSAKPY
jgi:hypothetical protein